MKWHTKNIQEILSGTNSSINGLSSDEAEKRLVQYGYNELTEKKKKPVWVIFIAQFKDFMTLVLIAAAIISGFVGDSTDTIIILAIVFLNAALGFLQEYKAEKAMEALKNMATPNTNVIRGGKVSLVSSKLLVPGDMVLLEAGNTVPADLRLIEVISLRVVESSITGESVPVDKTNNIIEGENVPLGDRLNMAYKGTHVTNGRAKGIVVATGMNTEIGEIAKLLQGKEEATPLQKRMANFGKKLSYLILIICVVLFGVGLLRGEDTFDMLLISISLAVAAIPEALPALITITLSMGAKKLMKQNVLIRKLTAVETLGSITYICTDKTGTLTQNKMEVVKVQPAEESIELHQKIPSLEIAMILNQDVEEDSGILIGDPTETAMVNYVQKKYDHSIVKMVKDDFERKLELPFDSDRKGMSTIHTNGSKYLLIAKGAVEFIVSNLKNNDKAEQINEDAIKMASDGIRVIAYAYKNLESLPADVVSNEIEKELNFIGLVGLIDPPREEAKLAIAECKTAGIHPVMITGDHKETAGAIARQVGLISDNKGFVVTGNELELFSDEEFEEKVESIRVYARVSPQQKLNIVKSLQKKGHFVAMTGDGVNDAPSLKRANIGVAMGLTGTDVSKEAAHMILLDDNFATIVKAIREGRRIYDNIRKFVKYTMTCNSAEIWTIFMAPLLGLPIPLLPIHILWINLVTDGLPGLALSKEKAEINIMERPPRKTNESLFAENIGFHIVWVGILMAALTLTTQAWAIKSNNTHWQTMVFTVLSFLQLAHVMAICSDYQFIYKKGFFTNRLLIGSIILTFVLQLAVIYLPVANRIFKTQPLTIIELGICIGIAVLLFHAVEFEKLIKSKRNNASF